MSFEAGLRAFGYGLPPDTEVPPSTVVEAFQRHFRPAKIDGHYDRECEAILAALLHDFDPSSAFALRDNPTWRNPQT
jgi:N-acetyl-anhydromuramyl-L-alanine amidase AmpD